MKNTKRISLLLAVLMLICALCGCSDKDDAVNGNNGGKNELSLGRVETGVYTNKYIGVSCTLGSNWTFKTAEELQDLPENIADMLSGSAIGNAISNYSTLIDMQAENANDQTAINVVYVKMSDMEKSLYADMTEEEVIDSILSQKNLLIQSYNQAGISVHDIKKVTVTFMGQQRTAMHMTADIGGIVYYTLQFSYMQQGDYGVTLTLASYNADKTSQLLTLFSKA